MQIELQLFVLQKVNVLCTYGIKKKNVDVRLTHRPFHKYFLYVKKKIFVTFINS